MDVHTDVHANVHSPGQSRDRRVSVASVWRWSWTPRWAVDVHKNVHRNVHRLEFLTFLVACYLTARAVKGGEAEAPDVSAPALEGPGHHS